MPLTCLLRAQMVSTIAKVITADQISSTCCRVRGWICILLEAEQQESAYSVEPALRSLTRIE